MDCSQLSTQTWTVNGYGLSSFKEDYQNHFEEWSHRARVRILMADPEFPTAASNYADQRDREEGRTAGETRVHVEAFEKLIESLKSLNRSDSR
jgi:hypothetical protein